MTSVSGLEPGNKAADFTLKNANLNVGPDTMDLADIIGDLGGIIVFTCNHCPYVVASESRIESMAERCKSAGLDSEPIPMIQLYMQTMIGTIWLIVQTR